MTAPVHRPAAASEASNERLRGGRLVAVAILGLIAVSVGVVADLRYGIDNIVPSVLLEIGAGLLLFSVLFWAERRFVVREVREQTRRLVEALTWSPEQVREMAADPDVADLHDRFSDDGQIGVADAFLRRMRAGEFEDGWALADPNWQLCRVQAWLWNNRQHFGYDEAVLDRLATEALRPTGESPVWQHFAATERQQFIDALERI